MLVLKILHQVAAGLHEEQTPPQKKLKKKKAARFRLSVRIVLNIN